MLTYISKYQWILLFSCCIITSLVLTQCNRNDPCKTLYCENGGVCYDGVCRCPEGYTGKRCEINTGGPKTCSTLRDCIKGKYQARELCTLTGKNLFYTDISLSQKKSDEVFISNFGNSNFTVSALINGNNISIPVNAVGPYIFSGNGTIDTTVTPLEIFIEYTENNSQDHCTGTYTMQ